MFHYFIVYSIAIDNQQMFIFSAACPHPPSNLPKSTYLQTRIPAGMCPVPLQSKEATQLRTNCGKLSRNNTTGIPQCSVFILEQNNE